MNTTVLSQSRTTISTFLAQVYGWMAFGLFISFGEAFLIYLAVENNPALANTLGLSFPFVAILQIVVVLILSFLWRKLNTFISAGLFIFYSILTGLFLGVIIARYQINTVVIAFGATTITFGVMAIYGYFTKQDLTKIGNIALMGLFGLIIATFFNIIIYFIFPGFADTLSWILTYLGLGIFIILVAYDTQKLKNLAAEADNTGASMSKYALQGALMLYLDFINIFIRILSIMGRRR